MLKRGRLFPTLSAAFGVAALAATIILHPAPRLLWNASASAPIGLYWVFPGNRITRDDMVVARLPHRYRQLAADRHYLPANVPLVKRVVAVRGDEICALGSEIFLNGLPVAKRRARDLRQRPLPRWTGCAVLRDGQVFLLMTTKASSFDGRYFGVSEAHDVVGKAKLLWAD